MKDKVIISTYPKTETDELYKILTAHGATVYSMPTIETTPLLFQLEKNIDQYDWLVFTSKNAITPFFKKYINVKNKIATIGQQTANKLKTYGYKANFTGNGKSSTDFALEFSSHLKEDETILLVLGNLAPDTLQKAFSKNVQVDRINVYQTKAVQNIDQKLLLKIQNNQYDALIVTSPSAYYQLKNDLNKPYPALQIISIGKTTTAAIEDNQEKPIATSVESSYAGLAHTIINYFRDNAKN